MSLHIYGCKGFLSRLCFCQLKSLHIGLLRICIELNVAFCRWINFSGLFDGTSGKSNSAARRNISEDLNPQTSSSYTMFFVFMVPCSPRGNVRSQIKLLFFSFALDLQVCVTELKVAFIFLDVCDPTGRGWNIRIQERFYFLPKHTVFCSSCCLVSGLTMRYASGFVQSHRKKRNGVVKSVVWPCNVLTSSYPSPSTVLIQLLCNLFTKIRRHTVMLQPHSSFYFKRPIF